MASHQTSPLQGMVVPPQRLPEPPVQCPRCESSNTKFCYYNNYSLSQPRHFCKSCRRYWTKGGTLRNVPVGGGRRKFNKPTSKNKPPRFISSHFFAVNSAVADLAAAGLISDPVDRSLQFGDGCGGFSGFIGSPGGGILLQTPDNNLGFEEIVGRGNFGDGGGGMIVGPYEEESAAKLESFSGGSQQVISPDNGSSSEGWAGLDTSTWQLN